MSEFFIKRPNFAWVVALFISLAGLLVISKLPVAQYPNVAPPQITITATYPGASAKVLVDSVTSVLEESLNGAKGLLYFESTNNSNGTAEIVVTFEPGTDPDLAQVDVQNRLKKAEARMPQAVLTQGLQVEQTSAGFLLIYALSYKEGAQRSDTTALGDYAARNINNELRRLPGVGKLQFFSSEAAMRVWIDPQKLVGFGLSIDDVSNAIRGQNVQVPAGAFGSAPGSSAQELTATLAVKGTLDDPQEFGQPGRLAGPARRCRAPGTRQGELQHFLATERHAHRGRGDPAVARGQRDPDRYPGETASRRTVGVLPRGHAVQRALRHLALRRRGH